VNKKTTALPLVEVFPSSQTLSKLFIRLHCVSLEGQDI